MKYSQKELRAFSCTLIPVIYFTLRYRNTLEMVLRVKCFILCFKSLAKYELFRENDWGRASLWDMKGDSKNLMK